MKPSNFDYVRAQSIGDALSLLNRHGDDSRLIAGGQSLLPAMNFRVAAPSMLIDIGELAELRGITMLDGPQPRLRIGAMTRHADLETDPLIGAHVPLLRRAIAHVAHRAVRNRGTIGGNIAHADPASELPACVVALDAAIHIAGRDGERAVPARDFFLGVQETAVAPDEMLVAIEIDAIKPGEVAGFAEFSRRRGDYAMAGLAAMARIEHGRFTDISPVFFGVGDRPILAENAIAALLDDSEADPALRLDAARAALSLDLDPPDDPSTSSAMRLELARVLLARVTAAMLVEGGAP